MKKLVVVLLGLAGPAAAQVGPTTLLDGTAALGARRGYVAASAWQLWSPFGQQRLQAGLGFRATGFFLPGQSYDAQNGATDATLHLPAGRHVALNAALHLRARVAGPVRVGFNIDLAGLTLGPSLCGQRLQAGMAERAVARPVRGNLLLGGTQDRGTLNSDFYVSVDVAAHYSVHAGFSHVVNAYAVGDQRFQRFANQAALGVAYRLR